jgi:catechol 2,3-dioxygenase-like lactoylglutathione lyase family enzyme
MRIVRITLAVHDLDRTAAFYDEAFQCDLHPINGVPIHRGSFAGMELQL